MYAAFCAIQMTAIITIMMMVMMMMMVSDLLADGIAVSVAVSKVGKACTTAGDTTNCGTQTTTHLECPTSGGRCVCQTGFTGSIGGDCSE